MSKIFEALQKSQDEISDIVLPAVFKEPGGASGARGNGLGIHPSSAPTAPPHPTPYRQGDEMALRR